MTEEQALLTRIRRGDRIECEEVLAIVEAGYHYQPHRFVNGPPGQQCDNPAGTNEVSCRLFAFAQQHRLTVAETLACFGHHYRDGVLTDPQGSGHTNLRIFARHGWAHLTMPEAVLTPR